MFKKIGWVVGSLALLFGNACSSTPSSTPTSATEPAQLKPLKLSGQATIDSLTTQIVQSRTVTSDLRGTLAPLLYLLPEGDYGVDEARISSLGSKLENDSKSHKITMESTYQDEANSYEDVVGRIKSATYTGKNELSFDSESEESSAAPNSDMEVTTTKLKFAGGGSEEDIQFDIRKYSEISGLVEIELRYTLSTTDDSESETYMEAVSGWAQIYPDLEGGRINEVGFSTDFSLLNYREFTLEKQTVPLNFTFIYDYSTDNTEEPAEEPPTFEGMKERLESSGWTASFGKVQTLMASAPDGTDHEILVDATWISHTHEAEIPLLSSAGS